ncbi:Bin1 [Symbiodinium sp. KB8]|nr:Bin1 [Symbiodinium sp. KB8]
MASEVAPAPPKVDRSQVPPSLLPVFLKQGRLHSASAFEDSAKPPNGIQLYVWPDTTLREVLDLVKEASPDQRSPAAAFAMGLVYPNRTGKMVVKPLAELHSVDRGAADTISLQQLGWRPADALSVAQLEAARHRA